MAKPKRGLIDKITISKVDEAANIVDVVSDFITIKKAGKDYEGKCPFHDDRHAGSFMVSPAKNICRCFVCQKTWFPIQFVQDYNKCSFPEAVKYIADKYGIQVETEGKNIRTITPIKNTQDMQRLPIQYFPISYVKDKMANESNTLLNYLRRLPWDKTTDEKKYFEHVIKLYGVGTMSDRDHKGWTVWWQIDDQMRVRDGKVMEFMPNGHRNKENKYSTTWISALLKPYRLYNPDTHDIDRCLFGLHLIDVMPDATIYIVESEKSAIIGTTKGTPGKVLFMATAGKGNLSRTILQPLIDRNRFIRLCPDKDAEKDWRRIAHDINYERLSILSSEDQGWKQEDGDKADIADIIIREMNEPYKPTITDEDNLPPVTYPTISEINIHNHPIVQQCIKLFDLS